ncbi:LysR substrate-binding domain-containing protein [Roseibium alexandrii]|nr:LysR substrate-binding domain-containing protein [Roseibium alexandrii]
MPPLNSLRAFATVAESKSLSAAGRELNVTHAAISQQVRALEKHLGLPLVTRAGRGIELTDEGRQLYEGLRKGFETIGETVEAIGASGEARPLNITMTPSFAVSWLMPRINDFRHKHPDIELMLNPSADVTELAPGGTDLAIRFGRGNWPGLEAELFLATNFVVVGANCLIGDRKMDKPEDILEFPWLQEYGTNELALWLEKQGVVPKNKLSVTHLPGYMVLEGLRRGEGISATAKTFIQPDIDAGNLKVLFEEGVYPGTGYHLVTRPGVKRPALKSFISWLRSMMQEQDQNSD